MEAICLDVYKEYCHKSTLLGRVIPLVGINAPMSLKDYIKPYALKFFKFKRINEGFFVITMEYEKKTFMIECEIKDGVILKMEISS